MVEPSMRWFLPLLLAGVIATLPDPAEAKRSLGILMMLHSIAFSRERNCRYYYPGYAYREPFAYDYKKRLTGLEYLDWTTGWQPYVNADFTR